jgi:hypothetical protein
MKTPGRFDSVGTLKLHWEEAERAERLATQTKLKQSYVEEVGAKLESLKQSWDVAQVRLELPCFVDDL